MKNDHEVLFKQHRADVRDQQRNINVIVDRKGDLIFVSEQQARVLTATRQRFDIDTWHDRLGQFFFSNIHVQIDHRIKTFDYIATLVDFFYFILN